MCEEISVIIKICHAEMCEEISVMRYVMQKGVRGFQR